jgi:hypothetical protein
MMWEDAEGRADGSEHMCAAFDSFGGHARASSFSWPGGWEVRRYGAGANLVWSATFDGVSVARSILALAFSADGGLVVASAVGGWSDAAWELTRYDPSGHVIWTSTYVGDDRLASRPAAAAYDSSGHLQVLGRAGGWGPASRYLVRKYQTVACMEASVSLCPSNPTVGQPWVVTLTVTNTGSRSFTAVTPQLVVNGGAFALGPSVGPSPSLPQSLASGASVSYTWTYTIAGTGAISLSLAAVGQDGYPGLPTVVSVSATAVASLPAFLDASLTVIPPEVQPGASFIAVLTVTNTGGHDAQAVTSVLSGTGGGVPGWAGPFPAAIPVLLPGGSAVFTWTGTATVAGSVVLSATVMATDAVTGDALVMGAATGAMVKSPAVLTSVLAATPSPAVAGGVLRVTMTVTNQGGTGIANLTATILVESGGSAVAMVSTPSPVALLDAGSAAVFTWTFSVTGVAPVSFAATVTGTDVLSGTPAASVNGVAITVLPVGLVLKAVVETDKLIVKDRETLTARATVTNTSGAEVFGIVAVLAPGGIGRILPVSGPAPSGPVSLPPNSTATFVWSVRAARPGLASIVVAITGSSGGLDVSTSGTASVTILPRLGELAAAYPNPATGDSVTYQMDLASDVDTLELEAYDIAGRRVFRNTWRSIRASDPRVVVTGLRAWAPGVYRLRGKAISAGGAELRLPAVKLMVKR